MTKLPNQYEPDEWQQLPGDEKAQSWELWAKVVEDALPRITGDDGREKFKAALGWIREAEIAAARTKGR